MPGDITRSTFQQPKHYTSVRMQQGRVQMDADWNEQADIRAYVDQITDFDVIGPCGVPEGDPGFDISVSAGNVLIGKGRAYVDGLLCESDQDVLLALPSPAGSTPPQPDLPGVDFTAANGIFFEPLLVSLGGGPGFSLPPAAGIFVAYLDVWQRDITALEDPSIREIALGGPDTCTRTKTVWQVKLLRLGDLGSTQTCSVSWDNFLPPSTGQLQVQSQPDPGNNNPCAVPAQAGYRSLENHLYRVEVHTPGPAGTASLKWSRENASVLAAWMSTDPSNPDKLIVSTLGKDQLLGFAGGQWVELTDDTRELWGIPGTLVQLSNAQVTSLGSTLTINPATASGTTALSDFPLNPKVRRWDQTATATETLTNGAVSLTENKWIDLEQGVQIFFNTGGHYNTGDYWLIPARTTTAISQPQVQWPVDSSSNPIPQLPAGTEHHYCSLALLQFDGTGWTVSQDCRKQFPPLTGICAKDVCFDDSTCALPGVQNVQQALDALCKNRGGGCCEVTVGQGGQYATLDNALTDLLGKGVADICICVMGGDYDLPGGTYDAGASKELVRLRIKGCGRGTRMALDKPLAFNGFDALNLNGLVIDAVANIGGPAGAITCRNCDEFGVNSCLFSGQCDEGTLLDVQGVRSVSLADSVFEAYKKTTFEPVMSVLQMANLAQLSGLFQKPRWTEFGDPALLRAEQLVALPAAQRSTMAAQLLGGVEKQTPQLTFGEVAALTLLADALKSGQPSPETFAEALAEIRNAAIKAAPGTAIVARSAFPATVEEWDAARLINNQIAGVLSLYGFPGTPLTAEEIKILRAQLRENVRIVGTAGSLHLAGNDLLQIALGRELLQVIRALLQPGSKGVVPNVFGDCLVSGNVIESVPNNLIGYHANLSSNDFTLTAVLLKTFATAGGGLVAVDVGTFIGDSEIYVGNHARSQKFAPQLQEITAHLDDVSRVSANAANLELAV